MSTFKRGEFRSYRALNKIHLGKYETDILQDDEFDFDGYSVRYAGMEYGVPQLQSLVGKWFVPAADQHSTYRSRPAGVQVSHATPEARERGDQFTMSEASEEEALVGTLAEQKQIREAAQQGNTDRLAQLRAQRQSRKASIGITPEMVESNPNAPPPPNAEDVDPDIEAALMEHTQATYIQAVPAHQARGQRQEVITPGEAQRVAVAEARNLAAIRQKHAELSELDPDKSRDQMGGTRHDSLGEGHRAGKGGKYQVVSDDSGGIPVERQYRFSDGATVGDGVVEAGEVKTTNVLRAASRQPVQVGQAVAPTPQNRAAGAMVIDDPMEIVEPQAARVRGTTQVPRRGNVGIDDIHDSGATGDVDEALAGDDLEDLLPGALVAGSTRRKVAAPPKKTEDEEIAEITADWSTKRNWHTRVQEAVDFYGDWPEALDAICAIESPKVVEQIRSKLAQQEAAKSK